METFDCFTKQFYCLQAFYIEMVQNTATKRR